MPLPFIPIAIAAGSAIAGAVGIGKGIKAASDNSKAGDINKNAQSRVDNAKRYLELTRDATKDALEHLGKKKLEIYDGDMKRFVDFYGLLNISSQWANNRSAQRHFEPSVKQGDSGVSRTPPSC